MPSPKRPSRTGAVRSYYRAILPFYEKELAQRRDLSFWAGLCQRWHARSVLEIGCGLGAVTEAVAAFAPVTGLDLSFSMLLRAQERLRRAGRRARVLLADARRIAFASRFDLVLAPGDPFSHWTRASDRKAALRTIARSLTPDGHFVLEGLYVRDWTTRVRVHRIGPERDYLMRERWTPARAPNVWVARYEYRRGSPGSRSEGEAVLRARAWDPAEVTDVFRSCGLVVERLWGDFGRRPFRPDSSRLIVVARRSPAPRLATARDAAGRSCEPPLPRRRDRSARAGRARNERRAPAPDERKRCQPP